MAEHPDDAEAGVREPLKIPHFARFWSSESIGAFGMALSVVAVDVLLVQVLHASEAEVGMVRAAGNLHPRVVHRQQRSHDCIRPLCSAAAGGQSVHVRGDSGLCGCGRTHRSPVFARSGAPIRGGHHDTDRQVPHPAGVARRVIGYRPTFWVMIAVFAVAVLIIVFSAMRTARSSEA